MAEEFQTNPGHPLTIQYLFDAEKQEQQRVLEASCIFYLPIILGSFVIH